MKTQNNKLKIRHLFSSSAVLFFLLIAYGSGKPSGDVSEWKSYIDEKSSEMCECEKKAKQIGNPDLKSKEIGKCIDDYRWDPMHFIEKDKELSSDEFYEVKGYAQKKGWCN